MKDEARAAIVPFLLECGEGCIPWMYPDEKGVITCAIGCALWSIRDALALPWSLPGGAMALPTDVRQAWGAISTCGLAGKGAGAAEKVTKIRLTQTAIDTLVQRRLDAFEPTLRAEWTGWDDAPASAQEALMRLAWAAGPYLAPKWPKLHAAWCAGYWSACAAECRIPALDRTEPGANDREAALFETAAQEAESSAA